MAIPAGILESAFADQLVYATAASIQATAEGTVAFNPVILGVGAFVGAVSATGIISTAARPKQLDAQLMDWANLHPTSKKRPIEATSGWIPQQFVTKRRPKNASLSQALPSYYALKRQQKVYRKNFSRRRKTRRKL